jgi:RND superfamily putative drug exporter
MLERCGRFSARRPWWVVGGWVVLLGAVWAIAIGLGASPSNDFTLPGSPSQEALDILEEDFPAAAGASATVVYHSPQGNDMRSDQALVQAIGDSVADLGSLSGVAAVVGPFRNDDQLFSSDGSTALANVVYQQPFPDLPDNGTTAFDDLQDSVQQFRSADLEIELGGSLPGSQPIEIDPLLVVFGLVAALIILALALRAGGRSPGRSSARWWAWPWAWDWSGSSRTSSRSRPSPRPRR